MLGTSNGIFSNIEKILWQSYYLNKAMKYQKIFLKDLSIEFNNSNAFIEQYELSYNNDFSNEQPILRPGLLILPGGAYQYCSDREAEPIALRMLAEGVNCFVLRYTCGATYPTPHKEVAFALDYLKKHHEEFHILDKNLSLVGFSAGGHLAASYAITYQEIAELMNLSEENIKPFALILGYPVITTDKQFTHRGTTHNITGDDQELLDRLSVEKHITNDFPPTYIFSTKSDEAVPIENSYMLIEELKKHNIVHQAHIFETGIHGGSLFTRAVYPTFTKQNEEAETNSIWASEAAEFLNKLLF